MFAANEVSNRVGMDEQPDQLIFTHHWIKTAVSSGGKLDIFTILIRSSTKKPKKKTQTLYLQRCMEKLSIFMMANAEFIVIT